MSELEDTGIYVAVGAGEAESIPMAPTSVTAFVGRARRGPANFPVAIQNFDQFERVFGGLWMPSTMSYAVRHFFLNGGQQAVIVRAINGGRHNTLRLPAGSDYLVLAALHPGSGVFLRAAVDYDNIPDSSTRFNLTIQRVRGIDSAIVEDQEIFPRVSTRADSERFITDVLYDSMLVRVRDGVPRARPDSTHNLGSGVDGGYVVAAGDGDDGRPLSDNDIIGSEREQSGLHALIGGPQFNLLCLPPLSRNHDLGFAAMHFAAEFCRRHKAIYIADPPSIWRSPDDAIAGLGDLGMSNENTAIFYPRLIMDDELQGGRSEFAPCGTVAGLLARCDLDAGPWRGPGSVHVPLRGVRRFADEVDDYECESLIKSGINCLRSHGRSIRVLEGDRTLAGADCPAAEWRSLSNRRFALLVIDSVREGTGWAAFEKNDAALWGRLQGKVEEFLLRCQALGAFGEFNSGQAWFVKCDRETTTEEDRRKGRVNVVVGLAHERPSDFLVINISQPVKPVTHSDSYAEASLADYEALA
ncbi:MAG: phage tail sheath family protein [Gammaproteobacteria bacterium]|nr:phage tail sheath family protein [Gammaproteobacteria bacterium]